MGFQKGFLYRFSSHDLHVVARHDPWGVLWHVVMDFQNTLETFSTATAKRDRDANTGRLRVSFAEESGIVGSVMPPREFLIRIQVFERSEPKLLGVRLRVEVKGGAAVFRLAIRSARDVLESEFGLLAQQAATQANIPLFIGTPE